MWLLTTAIFHFHEIQGSDQDMEFVQQLCGQFSAGVQLQAMTRVMSYLEQICNMHAVQGELKQTCYVLYCTCRPTAEYSCLRTEFK